MKQIKNWLLGVSLAVMLTATASAADLQQGKDAFESGDYATAFIIFTLLAKEGDIDAQNYLAMMYDDGLGVEENKEEAAQWYRLSAEAGDAESQLVLGFIYMNGRGVERDYAEAVNWFRLAAEAGNARAQNNLGNMYWDGEGVERDYEEAAKWYRLAAEAGHKDAQAVLKKIIEAASTLRAAERGHAKAQHRLGWMYENGEGVWQNDEEAMNWYRRAAKGYRLAAEAGDVDAQSNLGLMYAMGWGVALNDRLAYMWSNLAAVQGHKGAKQNRDRVADIMTSERITEAQEMTVRCIEQNFKDCESEITSQDTAEADLQKGIDAHVAGYYATAFTIITSFAEAGDAEVKYNIGLMYRDGEGIKRDYTEAVKWLSLAAEEGHKDAQFYLGEIYRNGKGVEQDDAEAVKWYRLAAEAGHKDAQRNLGLSYRNGIGVEQDYRLAYMWLSLADEAWWLEEMAERMTPEQIAEAQEMSSKCLAQNYKGC